MAARVELCPRSDKPTRTEEHAARRHSRARVRRYTCVGPKTCGGCMASEGHEDQDMQVHERPSPPKGSPFRHVAALQLRLGTRRLTRSTSRALRASNPVDLWPFYDGINGCHASDGPRAPGWGRAQPAVRAFCSVRRPRGVLSSAVVTVATPF